MSMAGSDITIEILKEIRDEIRGTNARVDTTNGRLDVTNSRLDTLEHALSHRLEAVETTLLDLAEQQRFVVRYTKAISERDARIEPRLSALENRVDRLESK
jgi:chromosome segregation ATPase